MNRKVVGGIALLLVVLVALVYTYYPSIIPRLDVLAISQVNRTKYGVAGTDGEIKEGLWRVLADTRMTNLQNIQVNHTLLDQWVQGGIPADEAVRGQLDVKVWQDTEPYYVIPFEKVATIEVLPRTWGTYIDNLGTPHKIADVTVEPVSVSVWRLLPAQKELHIPFKVYAYKEFGQNAGPLETDYPDAVKKGDGLYEFDLSYTDLFYEGNSRKIDFYNPLDRTEKLSITLLYTIGDYEKYHWGDKNFYVVTGVYGGPITSTTCFSFDNSWDDLNRQLDHKIGDSWSFRNYWFGEWNDELNNAAWWGTYYYFVKPTSPINGPFQMWGDYSPSAIVLGPQAGYGLVSEGYVSLTQTPTQTFQYPGWYTPAPNNGEGPEASVEWHKKRYPTSPYVYGDKSQLLPVGLSVCNYLAADDLYTPVQDVGKKKHPSLQRVDWNNDFWGPHNIGGYCPNPFKYPIPQAARRWVFNLDISTELIDTVLVRENYIDVSVSNFDLSTPEGETVYSNTPTTATVTLKNNSPYDGLVTIGVEVPGELSGTCTIQGGNEVYFEANQEVERTITFNNLGNLIEDLEQSFKFVVINDEPRETASYEWNWVWAAGLGVDTVLTVEVYDAEDNKLLGGILVGVYWGTDKAEYISKSTQGGFAVFETTFGSWEGEIVLEVSDPLNRYISERRNVQLKNDEPNIEKFYLILGDEPLPEFNWLLILLLIVAGAIAFPIIFKKRKNKKWS